MGQIDLISIKNITSHLEIKLFDKNQPQLVFIQFFFLLKLINHSNDSVFYYET